VAPDRSTDCVIGKEDPMNELEIRLVDPDCSDERIQSLARELTQSIRVNTEASVQEPQGEKRPGAKGDATLIGQILLTFLTSGAAVALIDVFKPFFARHPKLEVEITSAAGETFKVRSEDLSAKQVNSTIDKLRRAIPART